jgi:hypothetical protein
VRFWVIAIGAALVGGLVARHVNVVLGFLIFGAGVAVASHGRGR